VTHRHRDTNTHTHSDRETDRLTDRQTDTLTERQTVTLSGYLDIRFRPVTEDLIDMTNVIDGHIQTTTHRHTRHQIQSQYNTNS